MTIFLAALALAAGMLLPAHGARATLSLVNTTQNNTNNQVSSLAAPSLEVIAGNLLVVVCRQGTTSNDTQSVSDTAGNTFLPAATSSITDTGSDFIKLWYAKDVIGNSTDIITCNYGSSVASVAIAALQYAGVDPIAPLDATSTGVVNHGSPASSVTSNQFSTRYTREVVVACASRWGMTGSYSAGPGYTMRVVGGVLVACEDKVVSSMQSNATAMMSAASAEGWEMVVGTFKVLSRSGVQVSSRSDTLSDPTPSATSNHAISFTVNTAITGSSTLTLTWPTGFAVIDDDCGDIDAATSSRFNFQLAVVQGDGDSLGRIIRAERGYI